MRRTALLLLGVALLAACTEPTTTGTLAPSDPAAIRTATVSEQKDLATLRAATGKFHNFEAAKDAKYTFLFMNMCMVDPNLGGMGYHYVNTQLLDDKVQVDSPEALLYEPQANGQLKLVAVEYVIPKSEWKNANPPELFGQKLVLNSFDLWALHVWVWQDNPSGLYASWNPQVTCDHAS